MLDMTAETKNPELREFCADDEALINEFFDNMGAEACSVFNRRDYNRRGALKQCAKPDPTRRYWLFLRDGKMGGYVFFMDWNTGVPTLGLAVRDELWGRGIGKSLVEFAKSTARDAGKGGIMLTTHIANLRAQTLYETSGFSCVGVAKGGAELLYLYRFITN